MSFKKQFEFNDHSGPVYCLTNQNEYLYSSGADNFIVRWDLNKLKQDDFIIKVQHSAFSIKHLKKLPFLFIGCSNGDLHVVNSKSKEELKFIQHHSSAIFSIYEIPEKEIIITGDAEGNICIWNSSEFNLLIQIPLNCGKIRSITHLDNKLIVGSKDGKMRFFDLEFFNQVDEIKINDYGIQSIEFIDGYCIIGGYDGYLYLLESSSNKMVAKIPAHKGPVYCVKRINDQSFATASRDKSIKIWDIKTLNVIDKKELKNGGHTNSVNLILKLNHTKFVSCSDDSKIIIWSNR